jgi:WD40 repeat protein
MRKIGLLTILIYFIQTVQSNYGNTTTTKTTNETNQLKLDNLVLVDTLAYIKSGNINALSWCLRSRPTASNTTVPFHQNYLLVAASVTTFQVWNGTKTRNNQSDATAIKWDIIQLIQSENVAHAVAFSPNGKWLALGSQNTQKYSCVR